MCTIAAVAGAVLTAAGTAMQASSQRKAQDAMQSARLAEATRQENIRKRGEATVDKTVDSYEKPQIEDVMSDQMVTLGQEYKRASEPAIMSGGNIPIGSTEIGGEVVKDAFDKAMRGVDRRLSGAATARGKVNALGRTMWSQGFGLNRAGNEIALNNDERRGSMSVLPFELDAAAAKAQNPIGDLLVGLGGTVMGSGWGGSTPAPNALGASGPVYSPYASATGKIPIKRWGTGTTPTGGRLPGRV